MTKAKEGLPQDWGALKSLISLWSCAADDYAALCCTSTTRDKTYVTSRVKHEGLWFLAIALADYGKAFQKMLDQGLVASWDCSAFKVNSLTGLPAFLGGFLRRVFDPSTGVLLDDPCVDAIEAVRQLTLMFSKIALPTSAREGGRTRVVTPERERRAMQEYVQTEQDVREADANLDDSFLEEFKQVSAMLFGDVLSKVDRDIYWNRLVPKHGPGAVADRLSSNGKYDSVTWTSRLQEVFSPEAFLEVNLRCKELSPRKYDILEPEAEEPVRVISVPKTFKTPRIIAIEPTCMQYMQQALDRALRSAIREDDFLRMVVGLDDQDPNRDLARFGSLSGELATLDLSEASDRVSNQHVRALFEDWPLLHAAIQSTRSRKADVPGHGVLRLAKYASMGSALCFLVEAMVFTTVIFMGLYRESAHRESRKALIKRYRGRVRVFGDDLIVPAEHVLSVVHELSVFGHKVNDHKSFWTGRFRESCGKEYYDGQDVSIVKVRAVLPTRRQDAKAVVSAVSLRNQLYYAGLWRAAQFMDNFLEKLLGHFPNVTPGMGERIEELADDLSLESSNSVLLGRVCSLGALTGDEQLHPEYHSPLVRGYYVVAKPPPDHLEGVGALLKCLIRKEAELGQSPGFVPIRRAGLAEIGDDKHLERSGRPERVSIKLGKRTPY